jgi:hypothetical protein
MRERSMDAATLATMIVALAANQKSGRHQEIAASWSSKEMEKDRD